MLIGDERSMNLQTRIISIYRDIQRIVSSKNINFIPHFLKSQGWSWYFFDNRIAIMDGKYAGAVHCRDLAVHHLSLTLTRIEGITERISTHNGLKHAESCKDAPFGVTRK